MILKQCKICWQFYPGQLKDPFNLCPIHNTEEQRKYLVYSFQRTRSINMDHFDVWDDSLPVKKGLSSKWERVCRVCGKRILNKNGKHSFFKRYCGKKQCSTNEVFFNFGSARYEKIYQVKEKNECFIYLTYFDSWNGKYYNPEHYVKCERCDTLLNTWVDGTVEVHHLVPVSLVDESNFWLMWDFDNLLVLCHKCHAKAPEHRLFRTTKHLKPHPNNRRLLEFMGEKS